VHKGQLRVSDLSRDFDFGNSELFAIRIDAFHQKRNCLAFDTNPYGVQRDAQIFDDSSTRSIGMPYGKVKPLLHLKGGMLNLLFRFQAFDTLNCRFKENHLGHQVSTYPMTAQ